MRPTTTALAAALIVAGGHVAGLSPAADEDDARLLVATTVAPLTSIVANVVGDRADVEGIVPEGTNSHTFEPQPSVAELLSTADVVYLNGLQLEEPTRELAEANLADDAEIVELGGQTIAEDDYVYDFSFPEDGGKPNPHLWTNPPMALRYAEIVRDDMSAQRPRQRRLLRRQLRRLRRPDRRTRRRDARVVRHRAGPQAAHLPRRLRVLRRGVRLGRDRSDPGGGLRGSDATRGCRADRAGRSGGRAGDLRVRGVPQPGTRADRSGSGRRVRRRAARRRPARRAGRCRALVARPDAVRLHHDGHGARWRRLPRWRPSRSATSPPTRPCTRSDFRGRFPRAGPAGARVVARTATPPPSSTSTCESLLASSPGSSDRRARARRRCCECSSALGNRGPARFAAPLGCASATSPKWRRSIGTSR